MNSDLTFGIIFSVFSLVVLSLINCKNSKLEIKKNLYSNVLAVVILSVLGVYLYKNNKDYFESEKCCPPLGMTPINAPECTGDDNLPKDGVRKCGKFIRDGKARCMSEGKAFSCK